MVKFYRFSILRITYITCTCHPYKRVHQLSDTHAVMNINLGQVGSCPVYINIILAVCWVGTKPGLWTLDWILVWTMDWTMDWIMDSILDSIGQ